MTLGPPAREPAMEGCTHAGVESGVMCPLCGRIV